MRGDVGAGLRSTDGSCSTWNPGAAGVLLGIGLVLWAVTVLVDRRTGARTPFSDPRHLSGDHPSGPRN
ncbi:hypothetical protein DQ239_15390 [Blastococcus sp. TF02-09]|uniref:hypothetical protein n=1 Tax=Blastococcus sp. TF02-09 TaxID=2250576 RepID=UPI000DE832E4|nr:hypothetical protein [Blastococcus sp. TF02-9]RBY75899.1 hypothetical protein DQ239_15390 [Blastococcus sp. TF02-9]